MYSDKIGCFPNGCFDHLKKVNDVLFTLREVDIISCVLNMRGSSKIASILEISSKTVEAHIVNIKRKIDRNAREGIIDFIERSGKGYFVRKHYQNLLIQSDFNKRLKRLSTIVCGNKAPSCYFFDGSENNKDPIILWLQKHLKFAGINLIICNQEEKIKECKKGEFFIYVLSESNDQNFTNFQELEKITNIPETLILLVLKSIKPDLLEQLNKDQYIDFIEQKNYYLTFFKILKKLLPSIDFTKTILQMQEYQRFILEPEDLQKQFLQDQAIILKQNHTSFGPLELFLEKTWWLIAFIFVGVLGISILFYGYKIMKEKEYDKNQGLVEQSPTRHNMHSSITSYLPEILSGHEKFIGRQQELQQIATALTKNHIVIITGRSGIGKSCLAIEYGKLNKKNTIVRYFYTASKASIEQQYSELAQELNINIDQQPNNLVMQLVNHKLEALAANILFVFDNVEQYDDVKEYLVNLPPNIKIIVTTKQSKLTINRYPHFALKEFSNLEAEKYIEYSLQNNALNKKLIQGFLETTGTLPYDLKCITAYLLDNPSIQLNEKSVSEINNKIKGKLFQELITNTDQITQHAWKILQYAASLDPGFINIDIINKIFPQNIELSSRALKKLESLSLIAIIHDQNSQIGFMVHQKLQENIQNSIKLHHQYSIKSNILIVNLLRILDQLFPEVVRCQTIEWQQATSLYPHILKILNIKNLTLLEQPRLNLANLYYKLAKYHLRANINYQLALKFARLSLNTKPQLHKTNRSCLANTFNLIGIIYRRLGNIKEGLKYSKLALEMRQKIHSKDHVDIQDSLKHLGTAYLQSGETKLALQYSQMALTMGQRLYSTNNYDVARALNTVGMCYLDLGEFQKSLEYLKDSLNIFTMQNPVNYERVAALKSNISYNHNKLGNHMEALKYATESVDIFAKLYPKGHPRAVYSLGDLGYTLLLVNDVQQGLKVLHQALSISKIFGMDQHYVTAHVLQDLGLGYFKNKNYQSALDYSQQALALRKEMYSKVINHPELAESLHILGDIYNSLNNQKFSFKLYQEALDMYINLSLEHLSEVNQIKQKIKALEDTS